MSGVGRSGPWVGTDGVSPAADRYPAPAMILVHLVAVEPREDAHRGAGRHRWSSFSSDGVRGSGGSSPPGSISGGWASPVRATHLLRSILLRHAVQPVAAVFRAAPQSTPSCGSGCVELSSSSAPRAADDRGPTIGRRSPRRRTTPCLRRRAGVRAPAARQSDRRRAPPVGVGLPASIDSPASSNPCTISTSSTKKVDSRSHRRPSQGCLFGIPRRRPRQPTTLSSLRRRSGSSPARPPPAGAFRPPCGRVYPVMGSVVEDRLHSIPAQRIEPSRPDGQPTLAAVAAAPPAVFSRLWPSGGQSLRTRRRPGADLPGVGKGESRRPDRWCATRRAWSGTVQAKKPRSRSRSA